MKVAEFHPEARAELVDVVAFYDRQNTNLGDELAAAVEVAVRFV